jgi:hypothetical protein
MVTEVLERKNVSLEAHGRTCLTEERIAPARQRRKSPTKVGLDRNQCFYQCTISLHDTVHPHYQCRRSSQRRVSKSENSNAVNIPANVKAQWQVNSILAKAITLSKNKRISFQSHNQIN